MKTIRTIFTLTVLCVTLFCPPHSFAQNFVDGQMPDTFLNVGSPVYDIKFSPDGTTIASGSWHGTVKLWDVAAGTLKNTLEGHTDRVVSVAFSPDGATIASGSWDDTIKLWDIATGTLKTTLEEHTQPVYSVAFSPDGTTIASGSQDNTVKLWDVATGTLKTTLEEHTDLVDSVAFSPDGTTIASGSWDGTVKLWDVATGKLKTILGKSRMSRMAEYAKITDVSTGDKDIGYQVYSIAFSPDGATIASAAEEYIYLRVGTLNNKDADKVAALLEFQINNYDNLPLQVTPENRSTRHGYLQLQAYKGVIDLWDVASGNLKATLEVPPDGASSVDFSPDATTLISGNWDGSVKLWDVTRQPKAPKATLSDHGSIVYSVIFSPDGTLLASGSRDGAIRLWTALPPGNGDGVVNIADLVEVAQNFGQVGKNNADINGDGVVNIVDIILVAVALGEVAGAPAAHAEAFSMLTAKEVEQWLIEATHLQTEDPTYLRGILFLEQLFALLTPKEMVLLANYPNPFNPETWIPYRLAAPAKVTLTIYAVNGQVVRTLDLGHQAAGFYESRSRAAYWDGRNAQGESVASGVYFYTLTADDFTATRKMLIRK